MILFSDYAGQVSNELDFRLGGGIEDLLENAPVSGRVSFDGQGRARLQYTIGGEYLTMDGFDDVADNCKIAAAFGFRTPIEGVLEVAVDGGLEQVVTASTSEEVATHYEEIGHPVGVSQVFWFNTYSNDNAPWTFVAVSLMLLNT